MEWFNFYLAPHTKCLMMSEKIVDVNIEEITAKALVKSTLTKVRSTPASVIAAYQRYTTDVKSAVELEALLSNTHPSNTSKYTTAVDDLNINVRLGEPSFPNGALFFRVPKVLISTSSEIAFDVNKLLLESSQAADRFSLVLSKSFAETRLIQTIVNKLVDKAVLESVVSAEIVSALLSLNKLENVVCEDDLELDYSKNVYESVPTLEQLKKETIRLINESLSLSDHFYKTFEKEVLSTFGRSELFEIDVNKQPVSVLNPLNILSFFFEKNMVDTVGSQESVLFAIDFTRLFDDVVSALDDIHGLANIDDDQYAFFGKTLHDTTSPTDIFALSPILRKNVVADVTDQNSKLVEKILKDLSFPHTSLLYFDSHIVKLDVPSVIEACMKTFSKPFDEVFTTFDGVLCLVTKAFENLVSSSEAQLKEISKGLVDIEAPQEITSKHLDTIKSDTIQQSEYIWANTQNYAAEAYFQDDYTGTNYVL